jgi:nicotinamide-nucleotide amidase
MTLFPQDLLASAENTLSACRAAGLTVSTAESCTGGLVAGCLTEIAGSSDVLDRGFVTYSNQAKEELLGVPLGLIDAVGAVSAEVAEAMAKGALLRSRAGVAVSVTGIAGPGGGSLRKPVGLVHFGLGRRGGQVRTERRIFTGDRTDVRLAAVAHALGMLLAAATERT